MIGNSGYAVKGDDATNGSSGILGYVGWGTMCLSGTCGGFSAYQNLSDERTKTKIHDLPTKDGLASILKLRPVRFHWKDAKKDKLEGEKLGFIAQDIEKVFPEVVVDSRIDTSVTTVDGKKESVKNAKTLSYGDLVVPVVKSIQELKAENDNLVSKTGALEAQLKAANDNIEELRHELRILRTASGSSGPWGNDYALTAGGAAGSQKPSKCPRGGLACEAARLPVAGHGFAKKKKKKKKERDGFAGSQRRPEASGRGNGELVPAEPGWSPHVLRGREHAQRQLCRLRGLLPTHLTLQRR